MRPINTAELWMADETPETMTTESQMMPDAGAESTSPADASSDGSYNYGDLEVDASSADDGNSAMSMLDDVQLRVTVELGRTRMYVEDVLRLNPESVIELDKAAGDPVDIYVNDRLVARGEVLVLSENFCVRVNEIIQPTGPDGNPNRN